MNIQQLTSQLVTRADGLGLREGRREGLYLLRKARSLGEVPDRFKQIKVLHKDVETTIRIRTDGGDYHTKTCPQECAGLTIGGPVTEQGTLLFGYGTLIQITQVGETWFELCPPEFWCRRRLSNATFVPRAELYVNGGIPLLITYFDSDSAQSFSLEAF